MALAVALITVLLVASFQFASRRESSIFTGGTTTGNSTTSASTTLSATTIEEVLGPCNCTVVIPWASLHSYNSISILTASSGSVVAANVTSERTVGEKVDPGYAGDFPANARVPVTLYNISVVQVLSVPKGSNLTAGDSFIITQIGGTYGATTMSVSGYPALTFGSEYVLFVGLPGSFLPWYYEGYVTVGGPQGLFYVEGGKVYSLNNMYPQADSWLPVKANGVPLTQFASEIQINSSSANISG